MLVEQNGYEKVQKWIGSDPSGRKFNAMDLHEEHIPYNAAVNSGAIVAAARHNLEPVERIEWLQRKFEKLAGCGYEKIIQDEDLAEEECDTGCTNWAIANMLNGKRLLDDAVLSQKYIRRNFMFYFRACSLATTVSVLASMGATIANGGRCQTTKHIVMSEDACTKVVALASTAGCYDQARKISAEIGFAIKSGVSGALIAILPGFGSISVYSPSLNSNGNSTRGLAFLKKFALEFPMLRLFNVGKCRRERNPKSEKYAYESPNEEEMSISERDTDHINWAIGSLLNGKALLSDQPLSHEKLSEQLIFYFRCCSLTTRIESLARLGAAVVNGGRCVTTNAGVFTQMSASAIVSISTMAGAYDEAGVVAAKVGIPLKTGVAGAILCFLPGFGSIAVMSPRLNKIGNSVRSLEFLKRFSRTFPMLTSLNAPKYLDTEDPRDEEYDHESPRDFHSSERRPGRRISPCWEICRCADGRVWCGRCDTSWEVRGAGGPTTNFLHHYRTIHTDIYNRRGN